MIGASVKISPRLRRRLAGELGDFTEKLIVEARSIAVSETPVDSGRARRNWRLEGSGTDTTAINQVPYIERLEDGYSKQARRGILNPTLRKLRSQARRITR